MNTRSINLNIRLLVLSILCFSILGCQSAPKSDIKPNKQKKIHLNGEDIHDLQEERTDPKLKPAESYGIGSSTHYKDINDPNILNDIGKPGFSNATDTFYGNHVPLEQEDQLSSVLIAEVAANRANPEIALNSYLKEAKHTNDIAVAKRIVSLAH